MLALILIVTSIRQARQEWVEVVSTEDSVARRAYFRRDSIWFGSGRRRTRALCREIAGSVLPREPADAH